MAITDLGQTIPYTEITFLQVVTAIIVLVVGWIAVRIFIAVFKKELGKTKLPELVVEFLARFLSVLLYVLVILLAVSAVGITVCSAVPWAIPSLQGVLQEKTLENIWVLNCLVHLV